MGTEFELKYAAKDAASLDSILFSLSAEAKVIQMATTYYDTVDGALSRRKWTLRLRKENGSSVITFKTAGDGMTRGEWEYAAEHLEQAAETLMKLGAPAELKAIFTEGIIPVCGAAFMRRAAEVSYGESVLEVALDAGKLFRGEREMPICEVEVELKQGRQEDAVAFAQTLAEDFGLKEESRSKFVRAVNL